MAGPWLAERVMILSILIKSEPFEDDIQKTLILIGRSIVGTTQIGRDALFVFLVCCLS